MPIDTPRAAHRNESFWQISWPPSCFRSIARILPGYGAANATCCLPWPWLVKTVMNRLSPVSSRLPAPSSAPITPDALLLASRRRTPSPSRCPASCTSSSRPRPRRSRRDRARPRRTASRCPGSGSRCRARGGRARAAAAPPRPRGPRRRGTRRSSGTSLSGVQFDMPAVNTSVLPSTVPLRMLVTTSSCVTGPTWWPPIAMNHSCCAIVSLLLLVDCLVPTCQRRACSVGLRRSSPRPSPRASAPPPDPDRAGGRAVPDRYARRR